MTPAARFLACSAELLSFSLAGTPDSIPGPLTEPDPETVHTHAERLLRAWGREQPPFVLLIGIGSGMTAGLTASMLSESAALIVCERDPGRVTALQKAGKLPAFGPRFGLIADTSVWTHLCLTTMHSIHAGTALIAPNPELSPEEKPACRELATLLRKSAFRSVAIDKNHTAPSISFGAVLKPGEPMLEEFLRQIPAWIHEVVLVWDAEVVPDLNFPGRLEHVPLKQIASPLEAGFDAQRNIMREACTGEWIFTLDGDELLSEDHWTLLPHLAATQDIAGFLFPRSTFFPDRKRIRAGFGLWPDLQLRLYAHTPSVRYIRPIHEKLVGLGGAQAVALEPAIEHFSHLVKTEQELEDKLRRFDRASGGAVHHTLNREYPNIPAELLAPPSRQQGCTSIVVLPEILE